MVSKNTFQNINEYVNSLPNNRKTKILDLLNIINSNIPDGFENTISYGMPGWVVPLSSYPQGYHCNQKLPLPFLSIASQKNFIAIYHMGIYAMPHLLDWFVNEYFKLFKKKPDMGKSSIRFKDNEDLPLELIAELVKKLNPQDWINAYESNFIKK